MTYDAQQDFLHHKGEVAEALHVLNTVGAMPSAPARTLDLGGGQGMHVGFLSEALGDVYCADILDYTSLYGGEFCKLILEKHLVHGYSLELPRVKFIQTDGMDMLFRDEFFDLCFSFNAFEHIPDPRRALMDIVRVLKPGGVAYISFDPIWTADTGGHFSHRVNEPWAHLVMTDAQYVKRMIEGGADEGEVREFRTAMNRKRAHEFHEMFEALGSQVLFHDRYDGYSDPGNIDHLNFTKAKLLGYSEHELSLRRLRWVVRKG